MFAEIKGNESSFQKVKKAIAENDKTITLSCGQLTTGVTVKEWTAVLMLSNMKSPAEYMQAAFRAQNPYEYTRNRTEIVKGEEKIIKERYRKKNAYVFDFAPERTLMIFDDFGDRFGDPFRMD